jgi:hypothetical protein
LTKKEVLLPAKLKAKSFLVNGTIKNINQLNHFNQTPVACNITENKFLPKVFENLHGLKNIVSSEIFRHTGYYMPVFYEIELFNKDLDRNYIGNYKFDTTLNNFAVMRERKFRKINRKGSILKLKNETDIRSIYPMLQEFGLSFSDFFIFAGTWDINYHIESFELKSKIIDIEIPTITTTTSNNYGQPVQVQSGNQNNQIL